MNTVNRNWLTTKMVRCFGKCTACKGAWVRDLQTVGGNHLPVITVGADLVMLSDALCHGVVRCECGGRISQTWNAIKARVTSHVCSAKCVSSRSHVCDCSCGGKNHGAGNMPAIAEVA